MKNFTKLMMAGMLVGGFAMTANAQLNVVETVDLSVSQVYNSDYVPEQYEIDAAKVLGLLGCASLDDANVVSLDAEGQVLEQTGNNGYWYNAEGEVAGWGDGAWFIEYQAEYPDAWSVGNHPQALSSEGECNIGFAYGDKVVLYNVTVTIEAVDLGGVTVVEDWGLYYTNAPKADYATAELPFDAAAVQEVLGVEALTGAMIVSLEDGSIAVSTANNGGYWFGYEGEVTNWGSTAAFFLEPNNPDNVTAFNVGTYPDCEAVETEINIGFMNEDGEAVMFTVAVTIGPDETYDAGAGVESLISDMEAGMKVYNLQGVKMNVNSLNELGSGIYVVNGKKVMVRK